MPQWRIVVATALLALSPRQAAAENALLVRVTELDRSSEYRLMTREELTAMQETFRAQKKVFTRAKSLAKKEWESTPENGRFPSLSVGARSLHTVRTFRAKDDAEAALKAYAKRTAKSTKSAAAQVRTREAAKLVDYHIKALTGEQLDDVDIEQDRDTRNPLYVRELLALHNDARAEQKIPKLELDSKLCAAARKYAEFMARTGKYGHNENGTVRDRISAEGYKGHGWGENIAKGQPTAKDAVTGWMNSPGHHRNIMGKWRHIGFGHAKDDRGMPYWVTVFATP